MAHQGDSPNSGPADDLGFETVTRDWRDLGSPSYAVVQAVAEATGRRPDDLRPLNDVVDPDGLNALFERGVTKEERDVRVSLRIEGCDVVVTGDGRAAATRVDTPSAQSS